MNSVVCKLDSCTVAQTGKCLRNHPVGSCPNIAPESSSLPNPREIFGEAPLSPEDDQSPRFPPSAALSMGEASSLLVGEGAQVIGIVGAPDSGKTACLVSLYLLLAKNVLDGYRFADSKSLVVFDELSRGARVWSPESPEQLTSHTELSDGRSAGFLHLKLERVQDNRKITMLMPDLPGEWSNALIDRNRCERLSFLNGADAIWIMVDGRNLCDRERRTGCVHRIKLLIDRLLAILGGPYHQLHLVITRFDQAVPDEVIVEQIVRHAASKGAKLRVTMIASFSQSTKTSAGFGIAQLLDETFDYVRDPLNFWPAKESNSAVALRHALKIRVEDSDEH